MVDHPFDQVEFGGGIERLDHAADVVARTISAGGRSTQGTSDRTPRQIEAPQSKTPRRVPGRVAIHAGALSIS